MMKFDFNLEDVESRLRGGAGDPWRELVLLSQELVKLKEEVARLRKKIKKVADDE